MSVMAASLMLGATLPAGAKPIKELPPVENPLMAARREATTKIISPYDGPVICEGYRSTSICWQQRPDGRWQAMELIPEWNRPGGGDPWKIYPVWENPPR